MSGILVNTLSVSSDSEAGVLVRDVSFRADAGSVLCVVGPAGSGKSVLLAGIGGILPLSDGTIEVFEDQTSEAQEDEYVEEKAPADASDLQLSVSFQTESPLLPPFLSVRTYCSRIGVTIPAIGNLPEKADILLGELSASYRRALWAGVVLQRTSDIYVFDEPALGLDYELKSELVNLLREKARQAVVIVATNDPFFAALVADSILYFHEGTVGGTLSLDREPGPEALFSRYGKILSSMKE